MRVFSDLGIDGVVTLSRRRCDDLDVDAHLIEMLEPPVERGHHLADVLFLLGVDFLGWSIGKICERDAAHVDMRLRHCCGLRYDNMRVNIDGRRRGTTRETVGVMDAGGGAAIAILAIDHV